MTFLRECIWKPRINDLLRMEGIDYLSIIYIFMLILSYKL